ncbi:MAG: hypothetical protein M1422_01580 [Candidatus Thermoplasmatota archaeon]|nr:hypothetical protein [Candidatus Sysuiplasma jiujiangense]MBX8640211.1 hypothetical protein [Candidatus Sysuiplasma jiujiangense]MBX8641927.1 hypothetical protein [Candidatus Sysuiplasma jiujiangense]MCL4316949.1 hypothetical protein [Candidatus Thermoplasmatota archaeon]MCL5254407.1 hypothetical protein [Candidatus Thermoplasmatota archaeon]
MDKKQKSSGYVMASVGVIGTIVSIAGGNLMTTFASVLLAELGIYSMILK